MNQQQRKSSYKKFTGISQIHHKVNTAHHTNTQNLQLITTANVVPGSKQVSPQLIMSADVKTVSARNHAAEMDIRFKTNGAPPTNQNKSGQRPQHKTNNMVYTKKQKALGERESGEKESGGGKGRRRK